MHIGNCPRIQNQSLCWTAGYLRKLLAKLQKIDPAEGIGVATKWEKKVLCWLVRKWNWLFAKHNHQGKALPQVTPLYLSSKSDPSSLWHFWISRCSATKMSVNIEAVRKGGSVNRQVLLHRHGPKTLCVLSLTSINNRLTKSIGSLIR